MGKGIRQVLFFLLCSIAVAGHVQAKNVVSDGVFIDGIDFSGMTSRQAVKTEQTYLNDLAETRVTVTVNGKEAVTRLADLGFECKECLAEKAANIGKEGNLLERYMETKDVEEETLVYEHSFSLDNTLVHTFVSEECAKYNTEPKNAQIHQRQGKPLIKDSKNGSKVVEDETTEKIKRTILEDWDRTSKLVIPAITVEVLPAFDSAKAAECKDLLGEFSSGYHSSNTNRAKNLENAANLIDGTVLFSGEQFSMYQALFPITEENGFEKAGSYAGGKVVQSVGGGICQATTALYNAVLWAELEVIQRNPHSMTVSYAEPSKDAAIAGTYKDLKFSNNWNTPIYIEAVTENKAISFRIWGKEVRPQNRTIEYVSEVLETIKPGKDIITEDPNIPAGERTVTQEAYTGYKAELYKVIKTEGKEEKREKVNYSEYAATPRYITVGTGSAKGRKKDNSEDAKTIEDKRNLGESTDGLKKAASIETQE